MRLFLATHFPAEVLRDLNERVSRFKSRLPPASWVKPETQHLTFAFLGDQTEMLLAKITPPLREQLATLPKFDAQLRGSGFFPNSRHARVGWIGITPEQPFNDIARVVRDVVTKNGVTLDRGDFKAHLTMMRLRDNWPPASIDLFCKSLRDYESATFRVDAVTLFNSQLHPQGAIHTALERFELA
jgi:2'-5' RNA ligase